MTAREQLIRARMGMLALADQLQNISVACKRAGISRSHFYEIKAAFEKYGRDGLAPQPRRRSLTTRPWSFMPASPGSAGRGPRATPGRSRATSTPAGWCPRIPACASVPRGAVAAVDRAPLGSCVVLSRWPVVAGRQPGLHPPAGPDLLGRMV